MNEEELKQRLALHFLPGIGPVLARSLLSYCGSIEQIFRMKKSRLERIPGIGKERASKIDRKGLMEKAEREIIFMKKHKIQSLFYLDKEYPARLKNCDDAPLMLFSKGNISLNAPRMIAIVGTRYITPYGRDTLHNLVEGLTKYNPVIVSGLAYGIDVQAHRFALQNNLPTIGVVAHGLDRIYPAEHKSVAEKMLTGGAILTEYPSKTNPDRENFPARNRIVAGMCDAVIVVESAARGGALITAEFANDYNRDVFALPGRITDTFSRGCNQLIRQNKAMLLEDADQFAEMMSYDLDIAKHPKSKYHQLDLFATLSEEERRLVDILKESGQINIDALALAASLPVSRIAAMLLKLEFDGLLHSLPGKIYELA